MTNLAFDTHSAVKELQKAGMPVKQAESVVATLRKSREFDVSHLATKMDLKDVKVTLDKKIDNVKSELKADIAALQINMIKWIVPLMLGQTALIAALVKLL